MQCVNVFYYFFRDFFNAKTGNPQRPDLDSFVLDCLYQNEYPHKNVTLGPRVSCFPNNNWTPSTAAGFRT